MDGQKVSLYEILVKGHLGRHCSVWFGGWEIATMDHGEAVLSGRDCGPGCAACSLRRANLELPLVAVTGFGPEK